MAVTLWRVAVGAAGIYFAQDQSSTILDDQSLSYLSNLGVGVAYLALAAYPAVVAGRRHEPRSGWLRGALTVMMVLVATVSMLALDEGLDGPHGLVPALVLADWLFVGRNQFRTRGWEPLTWIAFPLAYLLYYQASDLAIYDILADDEIGTTVPLLLVATVAGGYLLWGMALLRRTVTSSGSQSVHSV